MSNVEAYNKYNKEVLAPALPKDVLDSLIDQKISAGHAKILVNAENSSIILKKIIGKKLSVRQTENLVKLYKSPRQKLKKTK